MPYKDPEKQAAFQNEWLRKRRSDWVVENGPCACGETKELFVVHKDPKERTVSHFWSYGDAKRAEILKGCVVLCKACKVRHWGGIFRGKYAGRRGSADKLSPQIVWAIRGRLLGRESMREIADYYRLNHRTVSEIRNGRIWGWLKGGRRRVFGIKRAG